MMPRSFLRSMFFVLAILLVATSTAAAFQAPPPPATPPAPVTPRNPTNPAAQRQAGQPQGSRPASAQAAWPTTGTALEPVTVDQVAPGLSYRPVKTLGVTTEPYLPETDTVYLNRPGHLFIDHANNSLYVVEDSGNRLLKFNASGALQWKVGKAGVPYGDQYVLNSPRDIAKAPDGNIWVADGYRIVEYTPAGVYVQEVSGIEFDAENNSTDWFDNAYGIAFDGLNHLFVSEQYNQRVLVFDWATGTAPVLKKTATIGTKNAPGNDDTHLGSPIRLEAQADGTLYILEQWNGQVRRCPYDATGDSWTCSVFYSGMNNPMGLAFDAAGSLYISDNNNGRIVKCTGSTSDTCSDYITDLWAWDIALDTSGKLYAAMPWECMIAQYSAAGQRITQTYLGTENVCYQTDNQHFNQPRAKLDPQGNLYVLEEAGQRLLKFSPTGSWQWTFGTAGHDIQDNQHLNWPHNLDFGADGTIYIADSYRVLLLNPNKTYKNQILAAQDDYFGWIADVAVNPVTRNIYAADHNRQRVMIFNGTTLALVDQIGVTDDCRTDNTGLCNPIGLAFDSAGNLFVVQENPTRTVKKYNNAKQVVLTLGEPNSDWSEEHGRFGNPDDVTVDSQNRIYVSDIWNNRAEIFDSTGAYLATLGGGWGERHGEFRGVAQVSVGGGLTYVSDIQNARVEVFAQGVPGWAQMNLNGFGRRFDTGVSALEVYNGRLYAGTSNWNNGSGGSLWSSPDGRTWTQERAPGELAGGSNPAITDMQVFNGRLYVSTCWGDGSLAQLWRYDGTNWEKVLEHASAGFSVMTVFDGKLYVGDIGKGKTDTTPPEGESIWRSANGSSGAANWEEMATGGKGNTNNTGFGGFGEFNGRLYASIYNETDGMEIWRMNEAGTAWDTVESGGLGDARTYDPGSFAVFNNELYLGARNEETGAKLWKTGSGNSGTWYMITGDGFNNAANVKIESLFPFNGRMYAVTGNQEGVEVFVTDDGGDWQPYMTGGFGDLFNNGTLWSSATTVFNGSLYIGTWNGAKGGQIWQMLNQVYLPMTLR